MQYNDPEKKYMAIVYVKPTNNENGPGHVSTSLVKQSDASTKVSHTSFYPNALGSILNALTLGSIPVPGTIFKSQHQDLHDADHVATTILTKAEYQQARKNQKIFDRKVHQGFYFYSIFGSLNCLSTISARFIGAYTSAYLSAQEHKRDFGYHPPEDHCGIEVYQDSYVGKHKQPVIHNCVTSTSLILGGVINASNVQTPNGFMSCIESNSRFKPVTDKSELLKMIRL